jgi:anaerobic dimethyl sulfoxide reductase subunit B (iron-sulfur subunit)
MAQFGFYFDADRCVQCRACEVACSSVHNLEPGVKRVKILQSWSGEFPDIKTSYLPLICMQCNKPACEEACPAGAISKRAEDGIVIVDKNKCNGCQECLSACPFEIPQFDSDGMLQKCDFCLESGKEPVCAVHCPTDALKYGTMEHLSEPVTGKIAKNLPGPTGPSMIISPAPVADIIQNQFS